MKKNDIVSEVAARVDMTKKDTKEVVDAILDVIVSHVAAGEKVAISGFGAFDVTVRAARMGHNPQTGEPMELPESKCVKFKAGTTFKNAVKGE